MESGQLTPEMLKLLRGESSGDAERDADLQRQLSELLDKIVQRLIEDGYLNVSEAPKMPAGQQPLLGPGGMAKEAAQQVQFNLTEKGIDFLGYRTLKHLLGSIGKSSFCAHSMILYGEDRFTPAKKVALALTHLIRTQFPGDTLRVVLFHDTAEEIPLAQLARAQVGPYHTNTAEGLKLSRRMLMSQRKDM